MNLLKEKLIDDLEEIVKGSKAVMGIGARDLTGEDELFINGDEIFPIGSSIKIPILIEFFRKIENGDIDESEPLVLREEHIVGGSGVLEHLTPGEASLPLIDYAKLMINVSDNVATNILIDLVTMEDVNKLLSDPGTGLGLQVTKLQRKMMDWDAARAGKENISTPREAIKLLSALIDEKLSTRVREETLKIMKLPKRGVFRDTVPQDIEIANKPGGVEGVSCDLGIVFLPNNPYAITMMTKHIPKTELTPIETNLAMRKASKLIHEYFEEMSLATKYGRRTE